MLMSTLILAASLLAASDPPPEPEKGWVIELRGFTYHAQAKPPGWVVERNGHTTHSAAKRKTELIVEFLWPQPQPALKIEPVETQYYDDLRLFFESVKSRNP
jgi:hypothetical protein